MTESVLSGAPSQHHLSGPLQPPRTPTAWRWSSRREPTGIRRSRRQPISAGRG
jgi:hypothetical protein